MAEFQFNPGMVNNITKIAVIPIPYQYQHCTVQNWCPSPGVKHSHGRGWTGLGRVSLEKKRRKFEEHFCSWALRRKKIEVLFFSGASVLPASLWRFSMWRERWLVMRWENTDESMWVKDDKDMLTFHYILWDTHFHIHTAVNKSNWRCKRSSNKGRTLSLSVYRVG